MATFKKGEIIHYSDGLNHVEYLVIKATKTTVTIQRLMAGIRFEPFTVPASEWHRYCKTARKAMIEALKDEISECGHILSSNSDKSSFNDIRNIRRRAQYKLKKLTLR